MPERTTVPTGEAQLAETGVDMLDAALPVSAALLVGGMVLYRRSRAASRA